MTASHVGSAFVALKLGRTTHSCHDHYCRSGADPQGLTDFGPGRSELFGNSADDDLVVHDKGATHADVTEGSRGVWERLDYDWSDPRVRPTVLRLSGVVGTRWFCRCRLAW